MNVHENGNPDMVYRKPILNTKVKCKSQQNSLVDYEIYEK